MSKTETTNNMFQDVWLANKESWLENLERYRKQRQELSSNAEIDSITKRLKLEDVNKMKLINNNIEICLLNIDMCDNQIKIYELQQDNLKLKVGIDVS